MPGLRRALVVVSVARYLMIVVNLGSAAVLSRLLTPAEFGVSVLGASILGVAEALRELGSVAYLVQQRDVTLAKIRTVFTISLIVTLTMTVVLLLLSDPLSRFYQIPGLKPYIEIIAISYAVAPFAHPIYAVLSRDMEFEKLAALDTLTMFLNAAASVVLVWLGAGYLGLAWATVISGAAWALLGLYVKRDFSVYRPSLAEWRSVLAFGAYGSATAVLYRSSESLFNLILGKFLDARAVGLFQRGVTLSQFPEKVILAGIGAVALPAFSNHARQGGALKSAYLGALELMTAVQWPALILLAILANPIVSLLFGPQWRDSIPIVQIIAVALMFNFPTTLNYPVQVAAGAIRHTVPLAFAQMGVSLSILTFAAQYGIIAVALGTLITIPFNVGLSVLVVRAHVPFAWSEFAGATVKSAVVAGLTALGPLAVVALVGTSSTILAVATGTSLGGICWLSGLWLTGHPLFREIRNAAEAVANARPAGFGWRPGGSR